MRRVLLVVLVLALPAVAFGKAANFADVEDEVMCVSCNVPLNIAESPQADRERAYIRSLIDRGYDKERIKRALIAQYGDDVLALPKTEGFNWAAYLVPILLVLGLLTALAFALPRWRRRSSPPAALPDLAPADAARLDADIARYDL